MKAYVCRRYGGPEVVELADVATPSPRHDEVLIRIHATTVSSGDSRVRALRVPRGLGLMSRLALGLRRPRQPILGTELSGTVEEVGRAVTRFKPGDPVLAFPGVKFGCHAEYRVMAENGPIALKPTTLSFEEAAALCFGGSTALHYLGKAGIRPGESVLVIGASGAVGTAMVQLASHLDAHVTGVTSTGNLALVSALGAHRTIDYTQQDFTKAEETYDVIADTVGVVSMARHQHLLRPNGRLLTVAGGLADLLAALRPARSGNRRAIAGPAQERPEFVRQLADLAIAGRIRPVIDRSYDFARMVEAHAYVDTGRKRGSVVISLRST